MRIKLEVRKGVYRIKARRWFRWGLMWLGTDEHESIRIASELARGEFLIEFLD